MAVAHYLEALQWQKEIIKIHTIFGGKNPHPNYLVGGMACAISMQGDHAINIERLNHVRDLIRGAPRGRRALRSGPDGGRLVLPGVDQIGGGLGNYMVVRRPVPQNGIDDPSQLRFPAASCGRDLPQVLPVDPPDAGQVREEVAHSWYDYPKGRTLCIRGTA